MTLPPILSAPALAAPAPPPSPVPQVSANDGSELRDVSQQFEAIFLRQMLSAARSSPFGEDSLLGSAGEDTFAEMRDAQFAEIAAKSGTLGFAASIEELLRGRMPANAPVAATKPGSAPSPTLAKAPALAQAQASAPAVHGGTR